MIKLPDVHEKNDHSSQATAMTAEIQP